MAVALPVSSAPRPAGALQLGRARGVAVAVHASWPVTIGAAVALLALYVLPALRASAGSTASDWSLAFAAVLVAELSVLAHEASHALAARLVGLRVDGVLLRGLTAVAEIQGEDSLLVALAGPFANVALAALLVSVGAFVPGLAGSLLLAAAGANLLFAALDLLPLPGADGQRALRALGRTGLARQIKARS